MSRFKFFNIITRLALPIAIFAMIAVYLIRDIPWNDEAGYHLDGLLTLGGRLGDGFSWSLDGMFDPGEEVLRGFNAYMVFSPLYSIFTGLFDSLLGIEAGIRVTWIVGSLCLIAIFALVLYELQIPKGYRLVVLCILAASSISISEIGVSRAGVIFVLLAVWVALRFPQRAWASIAILLSTILGSLCRLEVIFAAPPLILLWWQKPLQQQSLDFRQRDTIYRWAMLIMSLMLVIGTLEYTSEMRKEREWLAFQQHYSLLNKDRLPEDSITMRDMSLIENDFPDATSLKQAWSVNPRSAFEYYLRAGIRTCWVSVSAIAPRIRLWFLPWVVLIGLIIALRLDGTSWRELTSRVSTVTMHAPSGLILVALFLSSVSSFGVVAEPRNVVGLTVGILLFFALLIQGPGRLTRILMMSVVGLWVVSALGLTLFEIKKPQPNGNFVSVAAEASQQAGRPLEVISYDSNLICMYLENRCSSYSSLKEIDPCNYFNKSGDLIVTERNRRLDLEQCAQGWELAADLEKYDLWLRTQNPIVP